MITHLIADMGGVLVQLEWVERMSALLGHAIPIDELHHLWVSARAPVDFESGRTNFDEFATDFIREFDLTVTQAEVQQEFLNFVQAPMTDCDEILGQLKHSYHLSLLSNTNPAHYQKLRDRYDFFDQFDQLFLSYQLGLMKPDTAIFHQVVTQLDVAPAAIAFFDDGLRNVEAARHLGINAYQVHSPQELMAVVNGWQAST
ncbi:MAG: HAD family phosphatase [Cyanobacteria bacterium J06607_6]